MCVCQGVKSEQWAWQSQAFFKGPLVLLAGAMVVGLRYYLMRLNVAALIAVSSEGKDNALPSVEMESKLCVVRANSQVV